MQTHKPKLVFLSETRQNTERVCGLKWRLGLRNCVLVPGEGTGDGLALFWDDTVQVDLLSYNFRYIDVLIKDESCPVQWRCTFVYGEPKASERHNMWTLLRRIKSNSAAPWCLVGDFNEAMWQFEHFSDHKRREKQMMVFREVLSHCDVFDLGFTGATWTFDNKQKGRNNVRVRLDRAVASQSWSSLFPAAEVIHLTVSSSDHSPILLQASRVDRIKKGDRCLRYEIMWERDEHLTYEIKSAWQLQEHISDLGSVASRLKSVMGALQTWSRDKFGSVSKDIKETRNRLAELQMAGRCASDQDYLDISRKLDELLYREEMQW